MPKKDRKYVVRRIEVSELILDWEDLTDDEKFWKDSKRYGAELAEKSCEKVMKKLRK